MNVVAKIVLSLVGLVVLVAGGWLLITLNYSYSTGERAGYVQKVSHKGWICKTWEGELAMANLPGTMPQIFEFTVRDESVAQQVTKLAGQRVSLSYEQHVGIPTSCFGDTEYFVTGVTPVQEAGSYGGTGVPNEPAAAPAPAAVPPTTTPPAPQAAPATPPPG